MFSIIILLISAASLLIAHRLLINNKRKDDITSYIMKAMAIALVALGIFRYFLSDAFVEVATSPLYAPQQSVARWLYYIGYAILPISVFSDSRLFRNLSTVVCLPASILSTLLFDDTMKYFLMPEGGGFTLPIPMRYIVYIAELSLAILIPLMTLLLRGHKVNFKDRREVASTVIAIPAMLTVMMPVYIPQSLIGYTSISADSFSTLHLGWIAFMILEIAVIILYFKRRPMKDRHLMLVFMTIAQVFNSMSALLRGFKLHRLPLQLCSIAAFFYLVAVLTKNKRLFHFCFIANTVGGAIAIALADFSTEALCFWNVHYMHEHMFVMVVPIVALALGVFPRVEWRSMLTVLKIFSIYFVCCLVFGTIINGYADVIGHSINFFYMLDVEIALDYLPFATFVGLVEWRFGKFVVYPILVLSVYLIFGALCMIFFLAMLLGYKVKDRCSKSDDKSGEKQTIVV